MIHVDFEFHVVLLVVVGEEWTPQFSLVGVLLLFGFFFSVERPSKFIY